MAVDSLSSIELALGALGVVLVLRLGTLVRVSRELPDAERRVSEAAAGGDERALARALRRFGYRLPFQLVATDLLGALAEDAREARERRLTETSRLLERRIARTTNQGQALDLLTLGLMAGIAAFSERALPTTPTFWSLAGALGMLLVASFFARRILSVNVLSSVGRIAEVLRTSPTVERLSSELSSCLRCGAPASRESLEVVVTGTEERERVTALVCSSCSTVVYRRARTEEPSSASWPLPTR